MVYLYGRASTQICLTVIILLSAAPLVRADYISAVIRIRDAFQRFIIKIPPSAAPDTAVLNQHYDYMSGNFSKYYNAVDNTTISNEDFQRETNEAIKGIDDTSYQLIADYMGVGVRRQCKDNINTVLKGASEWDKAGQQSASMIMALLPSLLTFGNLYVPRSSEAFGTSFLVGFMSAVFGFGLPVKSITAVPVKQTVTLSRLSWRALSDLGKLGQLDKKKANPARLDDLQKWSDDQGGRMSTADRAFAGVSHAALDWRARQHWWHFPSLLVAGSQAIILFLSVFPLFMGYGVPNLIFDCSATYV
jgi:hypothetical protein